MAEQPLTETRAAHGDLSLVRDHCDRAGGYLLAAALRMVEHRAHQRYHSALYPEALDSVSRDDLRLARVCVLNAIETAERVLATIDAAEGYGDDDEGPGNVKRLPVALRAVEGGSDAVA